MYGREVLYGVDVTGSQFMSRPGVVAAAAFAATAHEGQMRLTKDPYIMHCLETAAIVEGLMAPSAYAEDDERCVRCAPACNRIRAMGRSTACA